MLRKIWDFISRQNRAGLIAIVLCSSWAFIGCLVMYFTPLSALDRYDGVVTSLKVKSNKSIYASNYGRRRSRSDTRITLNTSSKIFKLRELQRYDDMISDIEVNDTVTIYVKHWYQYILTPTTWNGILQIERGGKAFYKFRWAKFDYLIGMLAFGLFCLVFWGLLIIELYTDKYVRQKYLNTKPPVITLRKNQD